MEGRQQLVDLYQGQWSDFGNFWHCQPWEEHYQYDLLEDGCVRHNLACTPRSVGDFDWTRCLSMTRGITDTGQSHKYFHQYRFGAMLRAWFGSRCPKAMCQKLFGIDWYAWWNPVTMWLCIGVIRFLSDKMWVLNRMKLWKICENPSRVVACLSAGSINLLSCLRLGS